MLCPDIAVKSQICSAFMSFSIFVQHILLQSVCIMDDAWWKRFVDDTPIGAGFLREFARSLRLLSGLRGKGWFRLVCAARDREVEERRLRDLRSSPSVVDFVSFLSSFDEGERAVVLELVRRELFPDATTTNLFRAASLDPRRSPREVQDELDSEVTELESLMCVPPLVPPTPGRFTSSEPFDVDRFWDLLFGQQEQTREPEADPVQVEGGANPGGEASASGGPSSTNTNAGTTASDGSMSVHAPGGAPEPDEEMPPTPLLPDSPAQVPIAKVRSGQGWDPDWNGPMRGGRPEFCSDLIGPHVRITQFAAQHIDCLDIAIQGPRTRSEVCQTLPWVLDSKVLIGVLRSGSVRYAPSGAVLFEGGAVNRMLPVARATEVLLPSMRSNAVCTLPPVVGAGPCRVLKIMSHAVYLPELLDTSQVGEMLRGFIREQVSSHSVFRAFKFQCRLTQTMERDTYESLIMSRISHQYTVGDNVYYWNQKKSNWIRMLIEDIQYDHGTIRSVNLSGRPKATPWLIRPPGEAYVMPVGPPQGGTVRPCSPDAAPASSARGEVVQTLDPRMPLPRKRKIEVPERLMASGAPFPPDWVCPNRRTSSSPRRVNAHCAVRRDQMVQWLMTGRYWLQPARSARWIGCAPM